MDVTIETRFPAEFAAELLALPLPELDPARFRLPKPLAALDAAAGGRIAQAIGAVRNLGAPAVNTMTATETTQTLTNPSLGWQDDFNDGIIDGEKWNLPTDPLLIFEQNGVMNFRIVADQSQKAEIWAGLEAKPGQKPIREITLTVMLNSPWRAELRRTRSRCVFEGCRPHPFHRL